MKRIIPLLLLCIPLLSQAQQAMVSSGGDFEGSGGSFSHTFGQIEHIGGSSEDGSFQFGMQQPLEEKEDEDPVTVPLSSLGVFLTFLLSLLFSAFMYRKKIIMKTFFILLIGLTFSTHVLAQAPQGITHQLIVRDSQGDVITNETIGVRISILQGSAEDTPVFVETHTPISNNAGLITYIVGQGDTSDDFGDVDWANGPYFIKTEIDVTGGTNYTLSGANQILSVPYAFYAERFHTRPPKAIVMEPTNIGEFSATINGIVNAEGFSTTVVFEWGTNTDYGNTVTAIESPVTGSDDVAVQAELSGLQAATTYHYRIRGISAVDVTYSEDMVFTTQTSIPQLNTLAVSDITTFSAVSGGNITYDGGLPVTNRGVVWSTEPNPDIENNDGITSDGAGSGTFISSITDLSPGTFYYLRAYATNVDGPGYGNQHTLTTLGATPTAITQLAIEITTESAVINASVNPNHLETTVVFECGLTEDYGNEVVAEQSPIEGSANVSVSAFIDDLDPGTTYHFRVVAENELGVEYGNPLTFTTLGGPPTAITQQATEIMWGSALLNGFVNPNHFETTVVFEYGLTEDYGNEIEAEQSPIEGSFDVSINAILENLESGTVYHFRVKAENELGQTYGEDRQVSTYGTLTDIDDNLYYTIIIGNQEWMAENLRVKKYNNGEPILTGLSDTEWGNTTEGAYAIYPHGSIDGLNSVEEVLEAYGKLYNWYAATDLRGLCPDGWHVPSDAEWTELVNYVVSQGYPNEWDNSNGAGNALKSCRHVSSPFGEDCNTSEHPRWNEPQEPEHINKSYGTDNFGFSALPGGVKWTLAFSDIGNDAIWWSSTEDNIPLGAWMHSISIYSNAYSLNYEKTTGFSVRCVRTVD